MKLQTQILIGCLFLLKSSLSFAQSQMDNLQDLDYFKKTLIENHPNAFHSISQEDFNSKVEEVKGKATHLNRTQFNIKLLGLVAAIGDMHTNMAFYSENRLPFKIFKFEEGFFVRAVSPNHKELLGNRILDINGHPMEEIFEKLKSITPADNPNGYLVNTVEYMEFPEILAEFDVISSAEDTGFTITFDKSGTQDFPFYNPVVSEGEMLQMFLENEVPPPLYLKHLYQKRYWYEYLEEQQVMYVQINSIRNNSDEDTFEGFFERLIEDLKYQKPKKMVLDLRWNGGGNDPVYRTSLPKFIAELENSGLNDGNRFFVITGRYTASAAQHLVNDIEYLTNATFVGEPTKQNVQFYSDSRRFELPNSGIRFSVAKGWMQNYVPKGIEERTVFFPDMVIPMGFKEFKNNQDAVMEWILRQ